MRRGEVSPQIVKQAEVHICTAKVVGDARRLVPNGEYLLRLLNPKSGLIWDLLPRKFGATRNKEGYPIQNFLSILYL